MRGVGGDIALRDVVRRAVDRMRGQDLPGAVPVDARHALRPRVGDDVVDVVAALADAHLLALDERGLAAAILLEPVGERIDDRGDRRGLKKRHQREDRLPGVPDRVVVVPRAAAFVRLDEDMVEMRIETRALRVVDAADLDAREARVPGRARVIGDLVQRAPFQLRVVERPGLGDRDEGDRDAKDARFARRVEPAVVRGGIPVPRIRAAAEERVPLARDRRILRGAVAADLDGRVERRLLARVGVDRAVVRRRNRDVDAEVEKRRAEAIGLRLPDAHRRGLAKDETEEPERRHAARPRNVQLRKARDRIAGEIAARTRERAVRRRVERVGRRIDAAVRHAGPENAGSASVTTSEARVDKIGRRRRLRRRHDRGKGCRKKEIERHFAHCGLKYSTAPTK